MKKILLTCSLALSLFAPAAIFAQSDGSIEPSPQDVPVETTPPVREPAAQQSAVDVVAPVAQAPQPASQPVSRPAPAPQEAAPPPMEAAPLEETEPLSFETAQEVVEIVAERAPEPLQPWLAALAGALAGGIALFGIQTAVKKLRAKGTRVCVQCRGTGNERSVCATCNGTRQVEEEEGEAVTCPACEGEGEADCARCEGSGGTDAMSCADCRGEGTTACGACAGQGEAERASKGPVACPDCA